MCEVEDRSHSPCKFGIDPRDWVFAHGEFTKEGIPLITHNPKKTAGYSQDALEEAYVHELCHLILQLDGYPLLTMNKKPFDALQNDCCEAVSNLYDSLEHKAFYPSLTKAGYSPMSTEGKIWTDALERGMNNRVNLNPVFAGYNLYKAMIEFADPNAKVIVEYRAFLRQRRMGSAIDAADNMYNYTKNTQWSPDAIVDALNVTADMLVKTVNKTFKSAKAAPKQYGK